MDARGLERLALPRVGPARRVGRVERHARAAGVRRTRGAREAVELFCYRIGRELGSLAAALGGLDAVVFTAGIGEHAAAVRASVCRDAAWLGVELDAAANDAGGPRISSDASRVAVWVIPTDEELMIARHTRDLVLGPARPPAQ